MTEKKKTASAPKTEAKPKATKKTAKKTAVKKDSATKKTNELPSFIKKLPNEHIVGTQDYRDLVADHNEKFGTKWNTHRVQPAVFFGMWRKLREHYEGK